MSIKLRIPEQQELKPRISVFGVGGAGGNAVNNMIEKSLAGADFVAANTDSQALEQSQAQRRIQLGATVTQGLGAGANPEIGSSAAEESLPEIIEALTGSNMAFITAGMGGGTGTGAAPVIARAAREMGVLTVGVVTKPFSFEGSKRMRLAEAGIAELQRYVDTLIIIPNQNLFRVANERTTFKEAFVMADDVLYQGVKGVTDLMVRPGIVNLDFADVRAVMNEMGKAMMGSGEGEGERRALDAAEKAIANPLLDEVSLKGARGVLINITGGSDLTLFEVDEAANRIRQEADEEAAVFFGSALDPDMTGTIRVSVVATGIDAETMRKSAAPSQAAASPTSSSAPASGGDADAPAVEPAPQPAAGPASAPAAAAAVEANAAEAPGRAPGHAPAAASEPAPSTVVEMPAVASAPAHAAHVDAAQTHASQSHASQSHASQTHTAQTHTAAAQAAAVSGAASAAAVQPSAATEAIAAATAAAAAPRYVATAEPLLDDADFETPRSLRDAVSLVETPVAATDMGVSAQRELVEKMTRGVAAHVATHSASERPDLDEEVRVQIPSFLRRQAN